MGARWRGYCAFGIRWRGGGGVGGRMMLQRKRARVVRESGRRGKKQGSREMWKPASGEWLLSCDEGLFAAAAPARVVRSCVALHACATSRDD